MADTSNQGITPESTLQDVLDYQMSKAGGSLRSIIIRDRKGDCKIEPNVNVRFYNCTFSSLTCTKNNILFFRNCTLKGTSTSFDIEGATIIADKATSFESRCRFKNTSLQLIRSNIKATQVYTNVQLLSYNSTWTPVDTTAEDSKLGMIVTNSRIHSIKDTISKWDEFFIKASDKSFVKLDKSDISIQGNKSALASLKNSTGELWNIAKLRNIEGKDPEISFVHLENSSFLLNSATSFMATYSIFNTLNSNLLIEKATKLVSTKSSILKTKDSKIYIENSTELSTQASDKPLFLSSGSEVYTLKGVKEVKSVSKLFKFEKADISIYGDGTTTLQSQNDLILSSSTSDTDKATVRINRVASIKAANSGVFNVKNTSLNVNAVTLIESGSLGSTVLSCNNSSCIFSNITEVISKGDNAFQLEKNSALIAYGIQKVQGTNGTGIKAISNSKVLTKGVAVIEGKVAGISLENSSCIVKDTTKIIGNPVAITGDSSKIKLVNVETVEGDITGENFDVETTSTTPTISPALGKISLKGSISNMKDVFFDGPMSIGEATFENCIVKSKNATWTSTLTLKNSVFTDNINSSLQDVTLSGSILTNLLSKTKAVTGFNKSVITLSKGSSSNVTLQDFSTLLGYTTEIGDIALTASGTFLSAIKPSSVSLNGKSSFLGIGLDDLSLSFPSTDPAITAVGFFVNSGGNLGLQADDRIISEADFIKEDARQEIIEVAKIKISETVGSTSLFLDPIQLVGSATTITSFTVGASVISMTPTAVSITGF